MPSSQVAQDLANLIFDAFDEYNADFRMLTQQTGHHFEKCNWNGMQQSAVNRIDLYDRSIDRTIRTLQQLYPSRLSNFSFWRSAKRHYSQLTTPLIDRELYKTYFNSLTRKAFKTVGVNADIEFVDIEHGPIEHIEQKVKTRLYDDPDLDKISQQIISDISLKAPWADADTAINLLCTELHTNLLGLGGRQHLKQIELLKAVFYRNTHAFIVGCMVLDDSTLPLILAITHSEQGLSLDAVLCELDSASILFGFSRSYFHVDLETVGDTVIFLSRIMPKNKPISEMYTVLGRAKQGKTERFRHLFRHLDKSTDDFMIAPGSKGMVMAVFTLPSYDVVFKVIRDRFAFPKTVIRQQVLDRYQLVFKHDRAGRLIDAQEFRRLSFSLQGFSQELLNELLKECQNSVSIEGDKLIIQHLYIERRITPLNLYLRDATPTQAEKIIIDYGLSIKDLAMSNIFPGDLLLKNFGVSRHGRVIFYDYDELCLVTDCNFRTLPKARNELDEMSDEAWFHVDPDDVFPEQFASFLGLSNDLLQQFRTAHGEVFTAAFWQQLKDRLLQGEVIDHVPYVKPN